MLELFCALSQENREFPLCDSANASGRGSPPCGSWTWPAACMAVLSAPPWRRSGFPVITFVPRYYTIYMHKNAQVPSDQPHEAAPGWVWRCDAAISRYHKKTCLFVRFFTSSKNIKKWRHFFVNIDGLRPCSSNPSYGASQWALMDRLMQKKWPKPPQKSMF